MLADLNDYLDQATTPETKDYIAEALRTFDNIGVENYDYSFAEILLTNSTVDNQETLDRIIILIQQMQADVLKQFGIFPDEHITIIEATTLLKGIVAIPGHEDQEEIYRLTHLNYSPEEVLAELIECVTSHPAEKTLQHVERVTPAFITRIKELTKEDLQPDQDADDREEVEQRKFLFNNYKAFIGEPLIFLDKLLDDGIGLNLSFATYISIIGRELEQISEDRAAKELIGMALVSHDGIVNPVAIIRQFLHEYVADTNRITRIDIIINDIVLRLNT